jgi:predicted TIM-barrel fold metal-dependent hydrolase
MHRALGIERGVIVQPSTYGADHRALLDALAVAGDGYRGCAVAAVLTETDDRYVAQLHDAGVRGARFNFLRQLNLMPTADDFARSVARMRELGWYAKVQPGPDGILDSVELFEDVDIPLVIDHMGRPTGETADGPTVRKVVELLGRGNVWVMLSNGHKLSRAGYPWDDVVPIARAYVDTAPDRIVWASDWPHPLSTQPPPNDADLLELLYRYTPDADERRRVLVSNPAALFGFDA